MEILRSWVYSPSKKRLPFGLGTEAVPQVTIQICMPVHVDVKYFTHIHAYTCKYKYKTENTHVKVMPTFLCNIA